MKNISEKTELVREYYGKMLRGKKDLITNACCCGEEMLNVAVKDIEKEIDSEVLSRFYGCGSPVPPAIQGCRLLDLGCGTGKDVFIASKLVGPEGFVIGVDMTEEQLDVANRHLDAQMEKFGYDRRNVEFKNAYMEDLTEAGIEDESIDVVISNCVINLSEDKKKVFSEIFRILKPGGELYFSDVFAGRRVPDDIANDPVLYSECLGGAQYIEDFRRMIRDVGCPDYRTLIKKRITIGNPEIERKAGMVDFYSMTIRIFKLDSLDDICEDYGQVAVYRGTIPGYPHAFELDDHHRFITGKPMLVCGNTADMLQKTRYREHFRVSGDKSVHYGPFDCAPAHLKHSREDSVQGEGGGACC